MYLTFLIAVVAVVFNRLLIDGIFKFYGKWLKRLPEFIADPLGDCTYCFGGQIALWLFVVKFIIEVDFGFSWLLIIPYICITIFIIHILSFIWDLIEKQWERM